MLKEMQAELEEKQKELAAFSANYMDYKPSEEFIAATKYDIQTFLGLLEQDVSNVQLLHSIAGNYISSLFINRSTKKLYLTIQITHGNQVVYEKNIVHEWQ